MFTIKAFEHKHLKIEDLLSISSNDSMHFAWYFEPDSKKFDSPESGLWVCSGSSTALGTKRDWYSSRLPFKARRDNILFITANNSTHFVWYKMEEALWVGRGSSDNLTKYKPVRCGLPKGVKVDHILHVASNDGMHFVFLKKGTYIGGTIQKLDKLRKSIRYDQYQLGYDLLKT